ncbi:TSUP family transporter [bacterium]|nr:TSUP family transporter [bacterium]
MPDLVFTSAPHLAVTAAVILIAQIVYVVFGFGSGLIAVGSLALLYPDIRDVVVVLLLVVLPAELAVAVGSWRRIRWREATGLLSGVIPGVIAGSYVLSAGSPTLILTILGAFLVTVSLVFLLLRDGWQVRWPGWVTPPTGLVSGLLTGLFGTGGPPLIVYYHLAGLDKGSFRGNLMAVFVAMTVLRVVNYTAEGLITAPRLWSGLVLLPVSLLGVFIGHRIHITIPERLFRRMTSGLLGAIGVMLLVRHLGG